MAEDNRLEPEKWIQKLRRTEKLYKDHKEETNRFKKGYSGDYSYSKDSYVGKYIMKVNFIYYFVETIKPSIFSNDPNIKVKPKKDPALAAAAKLLENNTNYWSRELGAAEEFADCLFDSFFGPTAMYTGWEFETQMVNDEEQVYGEDGNPVFEKDGSPKMKPTQREVTLKDRPKIKWLDFWEEVRVDPDVKRTRHARWIAVRIVVPIEEFRQTQNIKEEFRTGKRKIKPTMRPEDEIKEKSYNEERQENKSDPEWVTYWEVWDREKMERKFVHETIKDDFLNEDISWPYELQYKDDPFPVTIWHAKRDPFSNVSVSEFKAIEDHIMEIVRHRSVQAAIVRRMAPKWIYSKAAGTKDQINKLQNSDILSANELNNPDMLRLAPMPEIPATFLQWNTTLQEDVGNVSGLAEFQHDRLANTATEATIAQGRSDVRKDARTREFEDFVVAVLAKVGMLCQQLQTKENTIMINGDSAQAAPQVFHVSKEHIQGEYDFDIIAGSMSHENEATALQNLQRFYEISLNGQDPNVNHGAIIESMAEYMGIDIKKILLTPEAQQQRSQQQAQAAQAAQSAQLEVKLAIEKEKAKPRFADIQMADIQNPADRFRVVEAAKSDAGVSNLSPGPLGDAQAQLGQLNQMAGGGGAPITRGVPTPAPQGAPRPSMPSTAMPMNASTNMAGIKNPAVAVHPNSLTPKR